MLRKPLFQNIFIIFLGVVGVYCFIYWDVTARARESYQEAERYMEWHKSPEKKKADFEKQFESDKSHLQAMLQKNKITQAELEQKLNSLEFDKSYRLQESSLKYAYQWYKDTYELFSPPESKWVKMARKKAPEVLAMWKQELTEKGVAFEDYMFE